MRIRAAVGLAIAIIALKFLVSDIFAGIEATLLEFFDLAQTILRAGHDGVSGGAQLPAPSVLRR